MPAQRAHLHALMELLISHELNVHYAEIRPMHTVKLSEAQMGAAILGHPGITMDCSEAVTCLCKWAGLDDPNGTHYNGSGYTGTLLAHLPHYADPRNARVGGLAVIGRAPGVHVVMVKEPDPVHGNPIVFSHGTERGPIALTLRDELAWHQNQTLTMLSIAHL